MTARFTDKTAVVTGAAVGIGRAIAERLATEGARVALFDFSSETLDAAVARLTDAGHDVRGFVVDVTDEAAITTAVAEVAAWAGGIDVLVNNAGVNRYGTVDEYAASDWDLVLGTNLKAPYLMAKHCIPHLRARGGGAIVNMASVQAFASQRTVAAYSASKGGVVAMTRTMALDHAAENIRVNAVCPGSVQTPMLLQSAETFHPGTTDYTPIFDEWGKTHPIGRVIQPHEVAALVAFLASDEASAITGAPFLIDGGLSAKLAVEG